MANLEALCLGEDFIKLPLRVNALAHQIHPQFHPFCSFQTINRLFSDHRPSTDHQQTSFQTSF